MKKLWELQVNRPWLTLCVWRGGFWVRVPGKGPGLWFATYRGHPQLFSEWQGYTKVHRVGKWARWKWLKRQPPGTEDMLVLEVDFAQRMRRSSERRLLYGKLADGPGRIPRGLRSLRDPADRPALRPRV